MNAAEIAKINSDRAWWERVGAMWSSRLRCWSGRFSATFDGPPGTISGLIAAKLIEQEDKILKLTKQLQNAKRKTGKTKSKKLARVRHKL